MGRDGSSRLAEFVEAVVVKNCLDMLVRAKAIDVIGDGGEEWINLTEQFDDELKTGSSHPATSTCFCDFIFIYELLF